MGRRPAHRAAGADQGRRGDLEFEGRPAGLLRRKPRQHTGEMVELSVTGGSLVTEQLDDLQRGVIIRIRMADADVRAEVRHENDLADGERAIYGLKFVEVDDRMRSIIERLLGPAGGGYRTSWR